MVVRPRSEGAAPEEIRAAPLFFHDATPDRGNRAPLAKTPHAPAPSSDDCHLPSGGKQRLGRPSQFGQKWVNMIIHPIRRVLCTTPLVKSLLPRPFLR